MIWFAVLVDLVRGWRQRRADRAVCRRLGHVWWTAPSTGWHVCRRCHLMAELEHAVTRT